MHICRSQSASAPQLCPPLAAAPQKSLCGMLPKLTMIAVLALGCTDAVPLDRRLPVSPADRRSRLASLSDRDASMSSSRSEDVEVACSRLLALEQRWSWCGVHNSDPERCTTTSAIEHANRARHFCVYDYNARRCRMDAVGWRCPAAPASPPWVAQSATPACSASLPKDERTLLFALAGRRTARAPASRARRAGGAGSAARSPDTLRSRRGGLARSSRKSARRLRG